jgi:hypothetical protein
MKIMARPSPGITSSCLRGDYALPDTTGDERKVALAALVDCTTRSTAFHRAVGSTR